MYTNFHKNRQKCKQFQHLITKKRSGRCLPKTNERDFQSFEQFTHTNIIFPNLVTSESDLEKSRKLAN